MPRNGRADEAEGAPGLEPRPVPRDQWDRPPWNRWSFQHMRELLPTTEIWRGRGPVRDLPRAEVDLDGLEVAGLDGLPTSLAAFLDATFTDGFLVLQRGAIVHERYRNGMDARTLHLSQSVAKSFVGALAGILVGRGAVDPDDEIAPSCRSWQKRPMPVPACGMCST